MGKGQSSTIRKLLKPKAAKKNYRRSSKRKVVLEKEVEVKRLEAVAAEMRAELKHMKQAERKSKAKLEKIERINSETREANRLSSINNARIQLYIHVILHLLDD